MAPAGRRGAPTPRAAAARGGSPAGGGRSPSPSAPRTGPGDCGLPCELTTVADDEAVVHDGPRPAATTDLAPDTDYELDGRRVPHAAPTRRAAGHGRHRQRRALRRDGVRRRSTASTSARSSGRARRAALPGDDEPGRRRRDGGHRPRRRGREGRPHRRRPDRGVRAVPRRATSRRSATGCVTSAATTTPTTARPTRPTPTQRVDLPGVTLAVLDTTDPGNDAGPGRRPTSSSGSTSSPPRPTGRCSCSATTTCGAPTRSSGRDDYFGINPDDSDALVDVVARRPGILGYFAGHTHRNRVRRFSRTGDRAVGRGGLREGLPGHVGRVPGVRAAASCRSTAASPTPTRWRGPSRPGTCSPAPTPTTPSAPSTTAASRCSRHEHQNEPRGSCA